ncbi:MAG: hypothetical protein EXQ52_05745 [Bryobacterales bacterium]|nr:hypothetical protein [Bryobacterales bacterium]
MTLERRAICLMTHPAYQNRQRRGLFCRHVCRRGGMRNWSILAVGFAVSLHAELRFARIGEMQGSVEVQAAARDAWRPGLRNMPIAERFWVRTGADARVEIELDEGSVFRLGPDSLAEISDYTRLSTGQRITLLSLDRGLAYFTGSPSDRDATLLGIPGAQLNVRRGTRLRLDVTEEWSHAAIIEGQSKLISPSAELDLKEGRMARLSPSRTGKFYLYDEIPGLDMDRWSESRDRALAGVNARRFPALSYGMADLEAVGTWIESSQFGTAWRPPAVENWTPFRDGKWLWYEGLGYTWVAAEPWGWLPYHHGRWAHGGEGLGWLWVPSKDLAFRAGEVYWMRAPGIAGWGPLAPGEEWRPRVRGDAQAGGLPQLFLNARTTFAGFAADAREIDPAGVTGRPKDALAEATFALALPSVTVAAAATAARPVLRVGITRVMPLIAGVACETPAAVAASLPEQAAGPGAGAGPPEPAPVASAPSVFVGVPAPTPLSAPPVETYYVAPIYTGVVVLNPQERGSREPRHPKQAKAAEKPPEPARPAMPPAPKPAPEPASPAQRVPRNDDRMQRNAVPAPAESKTSRQSDEVPRAERNSRKNQ